MNERTGGWRRRVLWLTVGLFAWSCGGSTDSNPPATVGGANAVSALPIDGLILIDQIDSPNHTGVLFDPHTGKSSPTAIALLGAGTTFAVSAAGRHVAWWQDAYHLKVSPIQLDASGPSWGTPLVLETKQNTNQFGGEVAFNSLGDRVYNQFAWWDFANDKSVLCPNGSQQLVSPDGRHHVMACPPSATLLYDDMLPVMAVPGIPTAFSPDGQWLFLGANGMVHVPSRVQVVRPGPKMPSDAVITASGSVVQPAQGRRGAFIKTANGGWVEIYETEELFDPLKPAHILDLFGDPEADAVSPVATFEMGEPDGIFALREGTRWDLAGISADGDAAFVSTATHKFIYHTEDNMISEVPISGGLRRITKAGKITDIHVDYGDTASDPSAANPGSCSQEISYQTPYFGRQQPGLLEATGGIVLCGNAGAVSTGWLGFVGDTPVLGGNLGTLPTLDGHAMLGGLAASHPQEVCLREIGSSTSSCMALKAPGTPIALVGHAVPGLTRPTTLPQPVWLSQSSAYPGQEVRLMGLGFGSEPATLKVGDVAVPAADVVAWTDTEIRFRGGIWQPPQGVVTVTTAAGKSERQMLLMLRKTALWQSPGEIVPETPVIIRQGINRISFATVASFALDLVPGYVDKIGPGPKILPGGDADNLEIYVNKVILENKWAVFGDGRVLAWRPATQTPGQDPQWSWNLIADYTGIDPLAGFLFEPVLGQLLLHGVDVAIQAPKDPAAPWAFDPLCINHLSCPSALELLQIATQRADSGDGVVYALDPALTSVTRLSGFALNTGFLLPQFDPTKKTPLPFAYDAIAAKGQAVLLLRKIQKTSGSDYAVAISNDGAASFAADSVIFAGQNCGPPLASGGATPAFFGWNVDNQSNFSVYRVKMDGTAQPDFAKGAPGLKTFSKQIDAELQGILYQLDPTTHRLYALDTAAPTPTWENVTVNGMSDHALGLTRDLANKRLLVARNDGKIDALTKLDAAQTVAQIQVGGAPGIVEVLAAASLANGKLVAVVNLPAPNIQFVLNQK